MRRRDFITLAGGAISSAVWAPAGNAQQLGKVVKVGYLGPSSPTLERVQVEAFKQRLHELGLVEGKDVIYLFRWAEGNDARFPTLASELVELKPDAIVTTGTPGTLAAKRASSSIPIVFASSANPVSAGLVASYSRPGGNVTGFTILGPELEGKRVQLLKEIVPVLSRIAVMWNPANPGIVDFLHQMRAAASALNVAVKPIVEVTQSSELNDAFAAIANSNPQAMLVIADRFFLMAYAPVDVEQFRQAAGAVNKILRGLKPADLPVEEPTRYELVINLKTAKSLGIEVSPFLQQRADSLIE